MYDLLNWLPDGNRIYYENTIIIKKPCSSDNDALDAISNQPDYDQLGEDAYMQMSPEGLLGLSYQSWFGIVFIIVIMLLLFKK